MRRHADNSYRIKVDETEYKIDVLPELGTMTCCAVIYVKRGSLWTHFCHTTDYEYHDDAKAEALRIIKCRHHVYPDDDFHRALQKMVDKWTEKWSRILSEDDGPWANVIPPPNETLIEHTIPTVSVKPLFTGLSCSIRPPINKTAIRHSAGITNKPCGEK